VVKEFIRSKPGVEVGAGGKLNERRRGTWPRPALEWELRLEPVFGSSGSTDPKTKGLLMFEMEVFRRDLCGRVLRMSDCQSNATFA
jgi:hypothetical protein